MRPIEGDAPLPARLASPPAHWSQFAKEPCAAHARPRHRPGHAASRRAPARRRAEANPVPRFHAGGGRPDQSSHAATSFALPSFPAPAPVQYSGLHPGRASRSSPVSLRVHLTGASAPAQAAYCRTDGAISPVQKLPAQIRMKIALRREIGAPTNRFWPPPGPGSASVGYRLPGAGGSGVRRP